VIRLLEAEEPCDSCGEREDVLLLEAEGGTPHFKGSLALCPQCRIKAEAMLRGPRKHGKRVRNWSTG
jgi:hypothetical protein